MAEKQIISVGAVSSANDIQRVFVNNGTDIKQATPAQILEAIGDWEDVTSALTTADTNKFTIGNLKLYANGKLRWLSGYGTAVGITAASQTIANVASGHRPVTSTAATCNWNSARWQTAVTISTTGGITLRSGSAYTSGNCYISAMWVTA
ncbi:MAG: hypothetical protein IKF99_01215 [Oscillospiraceae bacterium]|nr:hypothetical protein [Oscillospiraceae bacterium]